jgi:hypothetical protein
MQHCPLPGLLTNLNEVWAGDNVETPISDEMKGMISGEH